MKAVLPSPSVPRQAYHRGISLRPSDAINPYRHGRLEPDRMGVQGLTVWCKFCDASLMVTELTLVPGAGLLIEGICYSCANRAGTSTGIYRRFLIALAEGALPSVT